MPDVLKKILLLGTGGFIGSNLRYWISLFFLTFFGSSFPAGTLAVNAAGSFFLGFLAGTASVSETVPQEIKLFIGTGLLGALTTFSTFSVETVELFQKGNQIEGIINIGLNLVLALGAAALGLFSAQRYI